MVPDWLGNIDVVDLISVILTLVGLTFQINNSERNLRFAKKIYIAFGRVMTGTFAMLFRVPILFFLQTVGNKSDFNWQEVLSKFSLQYLPIALFVGLLVSFFAPNAPTLWKSLIKSIFVCIVCNSFLFWGDVLLTGSAQQLVFQNIFNVITTGTIIGVIVAMLLNVFKLRSDKFIKIVKNPFYD